MTTYTHEQILDRAMADAEEYGDHHGLKIEVSRATMEGELDLGMWAEAFNAGEPNADFDMAEDVIEVLRCHGTVKTKLEAKKDIDGVPHRIVWIPQNVSWVHGPEGCWDIAFADDDEPPFEGQYYTASGNRQTTVQMYRVDAEEELHEGCMYLEPLEEELHEDRY